MLSTKNIKLTIGTATPRETTNGMNWATVLLMLCRVLFVVIPVLVGRALATMSTTAMEQASGGAMVLGAVMFAAAFAIVVLKVRQFLMQRAA